MATPLQARAVLHLDLDCFFVSVERLYDPSLAGKPVIVGARSRRGVVASCSYEARAFGVHSAMPIGEALRKCPQAEIVSVNGARYAKHSQAVTEILMAHAPHVEKASIDEFYLELTGVDKFFGAWPFAQKLRQAVIKGTGLPISMGMGISKVVAKMATSHGKPNGEFQVKPGEEKAFLHPHPVGKLPMVGPRIGEVMKTLGIHTIGDLAAFPVERLEKRLGVWGRDLWQRAHGIDSREVREAWEQKSMSLERTFEHDVDDVQWLRERIVALAERLGYQLRAQGKLARCVNVRIRYSDFVTVGVQHRIRPTASDAQLIEVAKQLFAQRYDPGRSVRLIGVGLSELQRGPHQIDLFTDTAREMNLLGALDRIRKKHGSAAIVRSSATEVPGQESVLLNRLDEMAGPFPAWRRPV